MGFSPTGGWVEPIFTEWELTAQSWSDQHPHAEYVFVLEGQLFIESDGTTVECLPGDFVQVPADAVGRYWAPEYARMISVYGPNPEGRESRFFGLDKA
jgi:quercetin dioxygenase-like cupin family protein